MENWDEKYIQGENTKPLYNFKFCVAGDLTYIGCSNNRRHQKQSKIEQQKDQRRVYKFKMYRKSKRVRKALQEIHSYWKKVIGEISSPVQIEEYKSWRMKNRKILERRNKQNNTSIHTQFWKIGLITERVPAMSCENEEKYIITLQTPTLYLMSQYFNRCNC